MCQRCLDSGQISWQSTGGTVREAVASIEFTVPRTSGQESMSGHDQSEWMLLFLKPTRKSLCSSVGSVKCCVVVTYWC